MAIALVDSIRFCILAHCLRRPSAVPYIAAALPLLSLLARLLEARRLERASLRRQGLEVSAAAISAQFPNLERWRLLGDAACFFFNLRFLFYNAARQISQAQFLLIELNLGAEAISGTAENLLKLKE